MPYTDRRTWHLTRPNLTWAMVGNWHCAKAGMETTWEANAFKREQLLDNMRRGLGAADMTCFPIWRHSVEIHSVAKRKDVRGCAISSYMGGSVLRPLHWTCCNWIPTDVRGCVIFSDKDPLFKTQSSQQYCSFCKACAIHIVQCHLYQRFIFCKTLVVDKANWYSELEEGKGCKTFRSFTFGFFLQNFWRAWWSWWCGGNLEHAEMIFMASFQFWFDSTCCESMVADVWTGQSN